MKRNVADHSTHGRSVTEAREQTEDGFEQITKMFCNSVIKHCHEWIDSFLKTDAAEDLKQCECLAKVMKNLSLLKIASADAPATHRVPVAMDIGTPAPAVPAVRAQFAQAPLRPPLSVNHHCSNTIEHRFVRDTKDPSCLNAPPCEFEKKTILTVRYSTLQSLVPTHPLIHSQREIIYKGTLAAHASYNGRQK